MNMKKFICWSLILFFAVVGFPATAQGPVCRPTTTLGRASFPDGFMFGAASAAYQVEGAIDEGCRGPSLWDYYTLKHPEKTNYQDAKVAVDFYHRYKEDIQLLKKLNMDAYRFSIAWPRIFPHGRKDKGISKVGIKFYHDVIDELLANNITPLATVYHWDTPQDLEDEYGGFLSEKIVKDFVEFANFTFQEYGGKVKHWITFNEPYVFSRAGYDKGKKAPGRCSDRKDCAEGKSGYEAYIVSHNLLNAHAEAVEVFRQCEKCKGGKIGIAHSPAYFEDHKSNDPDNLTVQQKRALDFIYGWHMGPTTFGDYPQNMKDQVGDRLPQFTDAQKQKLKNSYDFIGMNYYSSNFAQHIETVDPNHPNWMSDSLAQWKSQNTQQQKIGSTGSFGKLPIYAKGLRKLLKYTKDVYGDKEIMITENGYGEKLREKDILPGALQDHDRKYYHQRHLLSLYESVCIDKVNVTGYFAWALTDNYEWEDGYDTRFGLYYVDFKNNLTRHEKESAKWFKKILEKEVTAPRVEL